MERHTRNRHTVRFLVFHSLHSKTMGTECELLPKSPTRRISVPAWTELTRRGRGLGNTRLQGLREEPGTKATVFNPRILTRTRTKSLELRRKLSASRRQAHLSSR